MKKYIFAVLFTLWIVFSLFIRLNGLELSPRTVGFDEASLGYDAYSIYLTGKDQYGIPHPLSLRSFNDFKPALYSYLAIPFIKFIGLNQTSIRAPSAVLGVVALIFLFFIFRKISGRSSLTSLAVVFIISLFPWRLHFSRVALETNISMAFFTGAVWCMLNFNKNLLYKISAVIFSTLSIYSYHSSRLAIPVLLLLTITDPFNFNLEKFLKNPLILAKKLWPLFLVIALYIPLFLEFQTSLLLTRLSQTNVMSHFYPFTPRELIFMPNVWLNPVANPLYYLGGILSGHVLSYISPKNLALLIYPGVIKSAQVISGSGMLGYLGAVAFAIGMITNLKSLIDDSKKRLLMYWILAGIIPAAVTWEWFYPLRSLNIYPALDIIAGLGILYVFDVIQKIKPRFFSYIFLTATMVVALCFSIYNVLNEYNYSVWDTNGEFQPGGFKESADLLNSLKGKYKTVYIDSNQAQSYMMFWFYMQYPPENIQKIANQRNAPGVKGPPGVNFDNFIYKAYDWPHDKDGRNFVFWTNSEVKEDEINSTRGAKLYKIIGPSGYWIASVITKD